MRPIPAPAPAAFSFTGETMGTRYLCRIKLPRNDESLAAAASAAVDAALQDVDGRMSTYLADSEVSRLNRHDSDLPVAVSSGTLRVFEIARQISDATAGAFDITVGTFVNAWGFGPVKQQQIVGSRELLALKPSVGYRGLRIDPRAGTISKARPDLYSDLSAIAKGFGVDQAARALEALGLVDYMIEVGGEVRARGTRSDGRPWQIGIEEPLNCSPRRVRFAVPLDNLSMATSGDYRICFERGGHRYSHEIDPRTGRPIAHRLTSVTVVAPECAIADAFATALIVLGTREGHALAESLGLAAYFIVAQPGGGWRDLYTSAFAALNGRRVMNA